MFLGTEYECEVVCCCKQPQPLTFIHNNDFYVVIQGLKMTYLKATA